MTFKGRPVWEWRPDFSDGAEDSLRYEMSVDAQGFGRATAWAIAPHAARTISLPVLCEREEIAAIEAFVDGLRGRLQGCWVPTFRGDLRLAADAGASDQGLTVEGVGLVADWDKHPGYRTLALVNRDHLIPLEASSASSAGDNELLALTGPVGTDVSARDTVCCWLLYARLSDEEISWEYVTDSLASATFRFVELPTEYSAQELGTRPVYLYRVTQGSEVHRWTSWGRDVEAGGYDWEAEDLTHTGVKAGSDFLDDGARLIVATADGSNFWRQFLNGAPPEPVSVEIFESQAPGFGVDLGAPLYKGDARRVRFASRGRIEVILSSVLRAGEWPICRHMIGKLCNHRLYDGTTCKVVAASYARAGTLTAVASTYVEADAWASEDDDWFTFGKVQVGGEVRMVTGHAGARLSISAPFRSASAGDVATAWAGCDRQEETCDGKFDNLQNFGGFPHIPKRNPVMKALTPPEQSQGKKGKG